MQKQIELGARVRAKDGDVGTVDKVVVDPEKHQPGYLVVKRGRVRPRRIVVPVGLVIDVSPDEVTLNTTRDALDSFPDYEVTVREGEYRKPEPVGRRPVTTYAPPTNQSYVVLRQRSVPDASVSVERGMDVLDASGLKVGQVQGLILESDGRQASHIILRHQEPLSTPRYRVVPADLVADVQAGEIHLRITADHVYGLGAYRPVPEQERNNG